MTETTAHAANALTDLIDSARKLCLYASEQNRPATAARASQLAIGLDAVRVGLVTVGPDLLTAAWGAVDDGRNCVVHLKQQLLVDAGNPTSARAQVMAVMLHTMAPTPRVVEFRDDRGRRALRYLGTDAQRGILAGSEVLI